MACADHEAYLSSLPPKSRALLEQVRAEIESRIPDATRCISYNMPALKTEYAFVYFAAFKQHIGIYPPLTDNPGLIKESNRFRGPKGNLSFPFSEPLPLDLIGRIATALHDQYRKR